MLPRSQPRRQLETGEAGWRVDGGSVHWSPCFCECLKVSIIKSKKEFWKLFLLKKHEVIISFLSSGLNLLFRFRENRWFICPSVSRRDAEGFPHVYFWHKVKEAGSGLFVFWPKEMITEKGRLFFFFLFLFGCTRSMWKFGGQGRTLNHSSDNIGSLTCGTSQRIPGYFYFYRDIIYIL